MAKKKTIKLRWHEGNQQFSKTIGKAIGRSGAVKPKVWYFGSEETEAVRQALEKRQAWAVLQAEGKSLWDECPTYTAERASVALIGTGATVAAPLARPISVAEAVKLYISGLKDQFEGKQIGEKHYASQVQRVERATAELAKLPLSVIGEAQLSAIVLRFCARPTVQGPDHNERRMSIAYAKSLTASLKWFVDWCIDADYIAAIKPKRYAKLWKARIVLTLEEQQAQIEGTSNEADHFSLAELQELWKHARPLDRALILCGLNCAFANEEIASLKRSEVKTECRRRLRRFYEWNE